MEPLSTAPRQRGRKYAKKQSQFTEKPVDNQSDFDRMIQVLIDANIRQAQFIEHMKGLRHVR